MVRANSLVRVTCKSCVDQVESFIIIKPAYGEEIGIIPKCSLSHVVIHTVSYYKTRKLNFYPKLNPMIRFEN